MEEPASARRSVCAEADCTASAVAASATPKRKVCAMVMVVERKEAGLAAHDAVTLLRQAAGHQRFEPRRQAAITFRGPRTRGAHGWAHRVKESRQPVHTVFGGAHLFRAGVVERFRGAALESRDADAPDAAALVGVLGLSRGTLAVSLYPRAREKLRLKPIEDYRID